MRSPSREQVRRLRPDIVFGADIIAGFPTETEDAFARALDLVDDCGLTHLHVFPYSERDRHARRAHAATADAPAQGTRRAAARAGRRDADAPSRRRSRRRRRVLAELNGIGRTEQLTAAPSRARARARRDA